jgi:hypothetical protein
MYFSTFSFIQGGIICIVNRRSTIYELPEYVENFFPLCDELETEGKWTKEEISTFPGFLMNEDGIIIVYRDRWLIVSVLAPSVVDRGMQPWSGQTRNYKIYVLLLLPIQFT